MNEQLNIGFFLLYFNVCSLFRYQQLLKEERTVISELSVFERKVDLWALGSSTTEKVLKLPSAKVSVDKRIENHLPEEVVEFERFLQ